MASRGGDALDAGAANPSAKPYFDPATPGTPLYAGRSDSLYSNEDIGFICEIWGRGFRRLDARRRDRGASCSIELQNQTIFDLM